MQSQSEIFATTGSPKWASVFLKGDSSAEQELQPQMEFPKHRFHISNLSCNTFLPIFPAFSSRREHYVYLGTVVLKCHLQKEHWSEERNKQEATESKQPKDLSWTETWSGKQSQTYTLPDLCNIACELLTGVPLTGLLWWNIITAPRWQCCTKPNC